ncbi:dTDP-4-amino-4,6-dideoxy-D-glucose ammonia-lyase [Streptomyces sp. RY43-2]|uniref:dTDP-4-amino-4,6-dideoxy-D-glucose ammonia-lyase n=1 Tax=Streptomyces macrolidinus TaxID=2952607 RepID=A0ABT0ZLE7_9ACTN|nr:dTDP-4-amino-4,6-dideoxy-D-glucose ammonia-lyase [Streptomyces macrolidinus]MCN9244367.1 dTDP-4-amino-4,6-dideoxy-D-glucose ammonia-lyase [Streptomyces macrolidinus]
MTAPAPVPTAALQSCAHPGADLAAAAHAVRHALASNALIPVDEADDAARHLLKLAVRYGNEPFTPLERARAELGVDREAFSRLLGLFGRLPELRAAVESGPAGKYWQNTVLPLERRGIFDAALERRPVFPYSVGLYPGPTCMFRCHFCVRVTGARYDPSTLESGNRMFRSVLDEIPPGNPYAMYFSGGLEPLTNPGLGGLVSHATGRGLRPTVYTNSFALTEPTLKRQPGLWDLHAVRTSLYGLDDEEYEQTTGKRNAFGRVRANLARFQRLRAERESQVRLGFSYIVLPGRARRLLDLVDFIAELDEAGDGRSVDFVNIREDYSGREDGRLPQAERAELQEALAAFEKRVRARTPGLDVDYGYALESLRAGADAELLRIRPATMRPTAHPQVSVQVDLLGDVYLYREAGFPDLHGAHRYIAGRVGPGTTLEQVVTEFVQKGGEVAAAEGDEYFMDGFDQVVTARLNQLEQDTADGWQKARGFLR